ncbi:MAG TPA: LamG domain-containing protein, partial [Methanosarcinaceae archaeon]|nr:LamG domain-containing protein [Methanosarcinaceae archaeon]
MNMDFKGGRMVKVRLIIGILIIIGVVTGTIVGVHAQEDGLVAEWHFDEGEGNVLKDSSGNGNDGTIYGATWVDGKYGKALSFDGVDDYVEVPDSMSLDLIQETSVEMWIKSSNVNKRYPNIFNKGTPHDLSYTLRLYDVYAEPCFQINTSNGYIHARSSETLMNNKWYHLVGTYDGSSIKLFVDGKLKVEDSCSGNIVKNNHALVMGTASAEKGYEYPGLIDEVRIYNRALTAEEIKE